MRFILSIWLLFMFSVTAHAASSVTVNVNHMVAPTNLVIPGFLTVTNRITNDILTASKIVLTSSGKGLISSAFGESDLASFVTSAVTNGLATIQYVDDSVNGASNVLRTLVINATNGLYTIVTTDINASSNVLRTFTIAATNGLYTTVTSDINAASNVLRNFTITATNTLYANISLELANKVDKLNGVSTNQFHYWTNKFFGLTQIVGTNWGQFTATNPIIAFQDLDTPSIVTTIEPDGDGGLKIVTDAGDTAFDVNDEGEISLGSVFLAPLVPGLTVDTLIGINGDGRMHSYVTAIGAGALTNNPIGGMGWFNLFITPAALSHGINILTNSFSPSLQDVSPAASTNIVFGNDGNIVLAFTNTSSGNKTNSLWIKTIQDIQTNSGVAFQNITNHTANGSSVAVYGPGKNLSSVASGTGAFTNNGSGVFGWFNSFITLDGASNNLTFNANQFERVLAGGTNVNIKNGSLQTNNQFYSSTTTTEPVLIKLAGGHNANALSVMQGPAIVGGFDSNGIATMTVSNATVVYPAAYRVFTQTADQICTNITTTETTWLGSGVGSLTLPANFWQVGRSVRIELKGHARSGGTPGNVSIRVKAGSTQLAANSIISWTANLADELLEGDFMIICRTNSATVGYLETRGRICIPSAASGKIYACCQFTNANSFFDTTASAALNIVSTNGASTDSMTVKDLIVTVIP